MPGLRPGTGLPSSAGRAMPGQLGSSPAHAGLDHSAGIPCATQRTPSNLANDRLRSATASFVWPSGHMIAFGRGACITHVRATFAIVRNVPHARRTGQRLPPPTSPDRAAAGRAPVCCYGRRPAAARGLRRGSATSVVRSKRMRPCGHGEGGSVSDATPPLLLPPAQVQAAVPLCAAPCPLRLSPC